MKIQNKIENWAIEQISTMMIFRFHRENKKKGLKEMPLVCCKTTLTDETIHDTTTWMNKRCNAF